MAADTIHRQPLTAAEQRVAHHVARALTNREIAAELGLREATVGVHLGRIYKKLGVRSRTELALLLATGEQHTHLAERRRR